MALKNVYYRVTSNNGQTYCYCNSENTVNLNPIKSGDCVGLNNALIVKFYDASTISLSRVVGMNTADWCQLVYPPGATLNWPATYFTSIVSAITSTNSYITLIVANSNNLSGQAPLPMTAPYTRISLTAHRSCCKVDIWYLQQEEEGGW